MLVSCAPDTTPSAPVPPVDEDRAAQVWAAATQQIEAWLAPMDEAMKPLPFLTDRQRRTLRQYAQREQLARARRLGVRLDGAGDLDDHVVAGRLVRLADSTGFWVVRELDHSLPYVTPDLEALLEAIGRRFQSKLAGLGLPPLRYEISSVLRTAASQADLRRENANATRNTSTHEYGVSVDIAYNGFIAPATPPLAFDTTEAPWLAGPLRALADVHLERFAARRAGEIEAVLGEVLMGLQAEGAVMVTYEERQPVFHLTVAQRF